MRILLLGEYSNVHATLAQGLRALGHDVLLISNGDFWKNYPRDIDLSRREGKWGGVCYVWNLLKLLPRMRGFDVVQLINPMFLEVKAHLIAPVYKYLRRHNKHVYLCAFGMDYYWVNTCCKHMPLKYSDFNFGNELRQNRDALQMRKEWLGTDKEKLNKMIAGDCDGIVAGLYEYYVCYERFFHNKTVYIPFPIVVKPEPEHTETVIGRPLRLFIGINMSRSEYKGTDIMLRAAQDMKARYPEKIKLKVAQSVPFNQYQQMLDSSDAILDQLYSYTPSMNPLEAMSKGIICIGGGEPDFYRFIGENELRPIINVEPTYDSVCHEIEQLVLHPERIDALKQQSRQFIEKHHDHIKVAHEYINFWNRNKSFTSQ